MDAREIEVLYRQYGGLVYRRCLRLLRDPDEAHSAVQEVFLRVMSRVARLHDEETAANYLFRTATNWCLNRLRNQRRLDELFIPNSAHAASVPAHTAPYPPASSGAGDDPEHMVVRSDLVRKCLLGFRSRPRLVAWLYFGEGLSQEEVADAVGITRQQVGRIVARIRERAGTHVAEAGEARP